MPRSMAEMADEIRFTIGDNGEHPDEVALRIANDLAVEFPNSTARGRQRAACRAAGAAPPPTEAEMDAMIAEAEAIYDDPRDTLLVEPVIDIRQAMIRFALVALMFIVMMAMLQLGWVTDDAWKGIF